MTVFRTGNVVVTNYGTGPFLLKLVTGPCTCPKYLDWINLYKKAPPSEPHYHAVCRPVGEQLDGSPSDRSGDCYLNGYRLDGMSVWDDDQVTLVSEALQGDLFS